MLEGIEGYVLCLVQKMEELKNIDPQKNPVDAKNYEDAKKKVLKLRREKNQKIAKENKTNS